MIPAEFILNMEDGFYFCKTIGCPITVVEVKNGILHMFNGMVFNLRECHLTEVSGGYFKGAMFESIAIPKE